MMKDLKILFLFALAIFSSCDLDEDPPFFSDSFANDFDPSYRTWGSQQWYVRASSKF